MATVEIAPEEVRSSERRRRRVPVMGISLFALMVAGGIAFWSLQMPIGMGATTSPDPGTPAISTQTIPAAEMASVEKDQERVPEGAWAPPPPLSPIHAQAAAAIPPSAWSIPSDPVVSQPTPVIDPQPTASTASSATTRSAVNMRSGPDRNAPVVTVVAAGTPVEVRTCDYWCKVVVGSQEGWIYQDYLSGR